MPDYFTVAKRSRIYEKSAACKAGLLLWYAELVVSSNGSMMGSWPVTGPLLGGHCWQAPLEADRQKCLGLHYQVGNSRFDALLEELTPFHPFCLQTPMPLAWKSSSISIVTSCNPLVPAR